MPELFSNGIVVFLTMEYSLLLFAQADLVWVTMPPVSINTVSLPEYKNINNYSCIKELNIDDNKLYFLNNKDYGNENDNSSVIYTELNNLNFYLWEMQV